MRHTEYGATLVEVLVAIALAGIMLPTLATALVTSHAGKATAQRQLQAGSLLREATEAMRTIRSGNWNDISNGIYHPAVAGSSWTLASGSETVDGFTRQIAVTDARRGTNGELVLSGGTADTDLKYITITVSWTAPYDGSVSGEMYLGNWSGQ